jgi:acyl phosphate:glycerol-3-phosphate acyltransferase
MINILLIVVAYLLGSISTAIIVCKLMGLPDPRSQGSRNPGATNVLRIGGKKAAAITLIGDLLKGLIPVVIAQALINDPLIIASVAMAAFLGHLYPVFFGFQGGKGVATALGVIIGLSWQLGLALAFTWLIIAKLFRISSLAALIATSLTPLYAWLLQLPEAYFLMSFPLCALVIWRHRSNIHRLIRGEERVR